LDADLYGQYPARDFVVSVQQVGIFENLSTNDGPKEERQWRKDNTLHYAEHELVERTESIHPKAHTTIKGYERVLRNGAA
jgi:hypothetical protein